MPALLYTDGITEAPAKETIKGKQNTNEEMFSEERLIETFRELRDMTPEQIKDGVLTALEGYKTDDDVTLMVVRRSE